MVSSVILDRGRGPEIAGTRITVYRIMDFLREGSTPDRIASELELTPLQVQAAISYIDDNRAACEEEYTRLLRFRSGPNPESVVAESAATPEELKRRILDRLEDLRGVRRLYLP